MTPDYTRRGRKVYRYYLCRTAQKESWAACPQPSVRMHEIEALVVAQKRVFAADEDSYLRVGGIPPGRYVLRAEMLDGHGGE